MKVYLKIHKQPLGNVVAVCDEDLLGKYFCVGELQLDINKSFYKGELKNIEEVIMILQQSANFNIVGINIIQAAIKRNIISEESVLKIKNIPIAMKFYI